MEHASKVYIQTDAQGRITRCEGGYTTPADLTGWMEIDEGAGDRYNLCQSHYFDGGLATPDGIPRYKLADGQVVERAPKEIVVDRVDRLISEPTPEEQLRADVDYLAVLQGVSL